MIRACKAASMIVSNILLILLGGWGSAMPTIAHTSTNETIPARSLVQSQQGLPPQPPPPLPEGSLRKTLLENDKLTQEVEKLKREGKWLWNNGATVGTVLVATAAGLIGLFRWLADRREERRRRAEERFQSVVGGLSNADLAAKIGAAVMLRTFLRKGYEDFYVQVFNLAVAYLRLQAIPSGAGSESDTPSPLTQALAIVFIESFPLARDQVLGCVDELPNHHPGCHEVNEGQKSPTELVIAGRNTSEVFEFVEEPFHFLAALILFSIIGDLCDTVRLTGDHGFHALIIKHLPNRIAVIGLVHDGGVQLGEGR
jgi:hypothetical protein